MTGITFSLISALGENREIGLNNDLVWRIPADHKWFHEKTIHHINIFGRKSFFSLPNQKHFADRHTIVLSRETEAPYKDPLLHWVKNKEEALYVAKHLAEEIKKPEIMVCGGGEIYSEFLHDASRMYLTHIYATKKADTFFPEFDASQWRSVTKTQQTACGIIPAYSIRQYDRI